MINILTLYRAVIGLIPINNKDYSMEYKYQTLEKEKNPFFIACGKMNVNKTSKKSSKSPGKEINKRQRKALNFVSKSANDYLKDVEKINQSTDNYNNSLSKLKNLKQEII
jgi:hypothetical protein